ncbi:helix-turn-helix domain-containing protein [Streptomyces sp. NPDC050504]|uniref:helix-turn-helix domain-containing protein n=1 Tax=Streptomyces sp. NPDC050504 TaxID=3365618 RepID=UPI0037978930
MPVRHFDGHRLRSARVAAGFRNQAAFGKAVGASRSAVATWENGRGPDPERLPAVARALRCDIDRLFPRHGVPDLADLRCDAGYAQYEVERLVHSKDAVGDAERGMRRLTPKLVSELTRLYGVSEEALHAAQDRSFGAQAPAPPTIPATLAAKIQYLLEHLYQGDSRPPSDADIARGINRAAGAEVVSEQDVSDLRTGTVTEAPAVVREGLAEVFGVTAIYFEPDQRKIVWTVVEGLRMLSHKRKGDLVGIATRGLNEGEDLSPELLALVNDIVDSLPEWAREGRDTTP